MFLESKLRRWALAAGIVGFAALHLAAIGPYWEITPDSDTYMEGAEAIVEGREYAIPLRPPVTSLLLAAAFPGPDDDYFRINAVTTLFTLLAMVPTFLMMRRLLGARAAASIVLLSLASSLVFRHGALLLSESFYLFFSMTALYAIGRRRDSKSKAGSVVLVGLAVLAASMTRIVGFVIALAVIAEQLLDARRTGGGLKPIQWALIGTMGLVLVADGLWELRNKSYGYSTVDLALQQQPWAPSEGYLTVGSAVERIYHNLLDFRMIGHVLANGNPGRAETNLFFRGMAIGVFGLFILGFLSRVRRPSAMDLYVLFSFALFSIYYIEVSIRWFAPLVPLLWLYVWLGGAIVWGRASRYGPTVRLAAQASAAVWLAACLFFGARYMVRESRAAQTSPFEDSWIKYAANYDVQRAAMWARDNTGEGDSLLAQHCEIVERISGRRAFPFPMTSDWKSWEEALETARPKYLLADEAQLMVQKYLLPLAEEHTERFTLVEDRGRARIYAVRY